MSTDRPSRRRIAGESAPSAGRPSGSGPRVVRKPVRRPGGARPGADTPPSTDVAPEDAVDVEETIAPEEATTAETDASAAAGAADSDSDPGDEGGEEAGAPKVVPAGRLPRRRAKEPREEPSTASATVERAPTARGRGRRVLLVLVAAAALVFGGFAAYWAYGQVRDATGVGTAQAEAESAATTAAEQILSYRYDQLDEHLEESQELMTPDFAEEFESISPALNDLAPQRQIVVEATAREAAPTPCGDDCSTDAAEILVFVDQARVADGEEQPTVFGNRITLSMVHEGGEWLVDDIEAY